MPLIKTIDQGIADGVTLTPWSNSQYQYLPWNAALAVALLADTGDVWIGSCFSGSDVLLQNSQIDQLAIATPIIYPDHFTLTDLGAAGERISAQLTNNTGAVADVRTAVRIDPIG